MTPLISVFTASHNPQYLEQAHRSVFAQSFNVVVGPGMIEWVLFLNGKAATWEAPEAWEKDQRITIVRDPSFEGGVGAAKRRAVSYCTAPILVELDHDDYLDPKALYSVYRAFESHPDASLVYSRCASVNADGSGNHARYGSVYGWEYELRTDDLQVPLNLTPTPHNASLIWFQPNHLRAFSRAAYDAVSGYDPSLNICDDQDLMCRLYLHREWVEIPEYLYAQRIHGENTQYVVNEDIQTKAWDIYEKYIWDIAKVWSERNGLKVVNGAGRFIPNDCGVIRLADASREHVTPIKMQLYAESLAPNGLLLLNIKERGYLNEHYFRAWRSTKTALFQESRIRTIEVDGVNWVQANLIAVKPGYTREGGVLYSHENTH